ncbi:MAG: AMP-binding protein [Cyanobacteriota bacterium]|nr:AMP-binding protein [Cyanobacteriota bacterium]
MKNNRFIHGNVEPSHKFEKFSKKEIEQSVANLLEKKVANYPNNLAIKDNKIAFTYTELNQSANRIARAISSKTKTQEQPIVLLFEQGINFITSIFGVLKTGNFYVPIDPTFPQSRNSYILADSQAKIIITNSQYLPIAESLALENCEVINIESISKDVSCHNLDLEISPDAKAYLLYTSGSTGKPKGVFQNNRNLLHNAINQINAFHSQEKDRMTLIYSSSVMGSVRATYSTLLSGGCLYPLNIKTAGLNALSTLLAQERITIFHCVATLFRHFADGLNDSDLFPDLRLVALGGEAMNRKDVELYKQKFPDNCLLSTGLGSTEAGTTCLFIFDKQAEITSSLVPPGYPVEGIEVLILDEKGNQVGTGEVGEIAIKSRYLALGYWNQPDLSREKFSSISETSCERLLRTGDMGRLLADGCLVHAGRKDFQVKIRGFRVDVSEIEMALMDYGFLKETVVVGHENTRGEIFLVAYIVSRQKPEPTVSELRNFISEKLPDYMIPSRFVFLNSIPLTVNGKIDRKALPVPDVSSIQLENFVPPSNPTEEILATIWENILGVEKVGIHDNFFELGGNSLIASQVISRIRQAFSVEITLQSLFEKPTISGLEERIKTLEWLRESQEATMTNVVNEMEEVEF